MLPRPLGIIHSPIPRVAWLAGIILLLPTSLFAEPAGSNVVCKEGLTEAHRNDLTNQLRKITGRSDLHFDQGRLRAGATEPIGGSITARELIRKTILGAAVVVLEDVSRRSDVVFARVVALKSGREDAVGPPGFAVQIDFADFEHVMGDARALEAFNAGWVLLHEFDHIVNDSADATSLIDAGECEEHINQMRRECDLPQRARYYATFLPLVEEAGFITRWVRLAFDQEQKKAGAKKRYWLVWDARLVGGLNDQKQIASLR